MDQMETFNISQDDDESDTSQEDLDEANSEAFQGSITAALYPGYLKYKQIFQKWARQEEIQLNVTKPLKFMLLDSDCSIISTAKVDPLVFSILPQSLRSQREQSYNRLYGVTEEGQSVLVNAFGFVPYFYALPSHASAFEPDAIKQLHEALNIEIINHIKNRLGTVVPFHYIVHNCPPVLEIVVLNTADVNIYEFHQAQNYSKVGHLTPTAQETCSPTRSTQPCDKNGKAGEQPKKILKVCCRMPKFVWTAVKVLQKQLISLPVVDGQPCQYLTFEGSINHNIRFMTDMDLCGCSWLEIPSGKYFPRQPNSKLSHCQIEVDAYHQSIGPASIQSNTIPPLRILSFDIECMTRPPLFNFPRNGNEQVLQIGAILTTYHNDLPLSRTKDTNANPAMEKFIFMLGSCDEWEDTHVFSFEKEIEMLDVWSFFVTATDPDILMGFNIKRFDIPYLLDRANVIKANKLPFFGRIKTSECTARAIKNESKKAIKYDEKAISVAGRIVFDVMILVTRHNTNPGRCRLRDVAKRYLKSSEKKEDISYTEIIELQNTGPTTRKKLASYCVQDARLPYLIMLKHNPNFQNSSDFDEISYYINKARESGTPLRYLVTKSPEYNTYFKLIRKHKNPAVTFVPNTPTKRATPTPEQKRKRRNSASPYLTDRTKSDLDLIEIPRSSSPTSSKPERQVKKIVCTQRNIWH